MSYLLCCERQRRRRKREIIFDTIAELQFVAEYFLRTIEYGLTGHETQARIGAGAVFWSRSEQEYLSVNTHRQPGGKV